MADSQVPGVQLARPANPNAVWLATGFKDTGNVEIGLLGWELYRQAFLIAARDGMGLQTRDQSLREDPNRDNQADIFIPTVDGTTIIFDHFPAQKPPLFQSQPNWNQAAAGYDHVVENIEALSRNDFVKLLHEQGWNAHANAIKPDAPPPPGSEESLASLDEFSQFAIVRQTHAAIAADGESPLRLGVLVRAYANLGQLTRFQWSLESQVFTARSLLYAQRMVAADPKSAWALWHRAYAYAMAGLQAGALHDLTAADGLKTSPPPAWVALLEPLCKYQTGRLTDLAVADPKNTSLGMYLAFLTVENSLCQGAVMSLAQGALKVNPHCLRLVDTMCEQTGPGMLNELTETGPQLFADMLPVGVAKMSQLPKAASQLLLQMTTPEQYAAKLPVLCAALINEGQPATDSGEPSWTVLGRMIQEITFAHLQRCAYLITAQWGIDASDFVNQAMPLVSDHPLRPMLQAYGLQHENDQTMFAKTLSRVGSAYFTFAASPFYSYAQSTLGTSSPKPAAILASMWRNRDFTSYDIQRVVRVYGITQDPIILQYEKSLDAIDPHSPLLLGKQIHQNFTPQLGARIEAEHGDFPFIARELGAKYFELKQWADAERCLKKYIAVSPDYSGYEMLARVYQQENRDDQWLATLQAFLQQPAYGLEQVNVEVEIAEYYMRKGDFTSALPYADGAAGSGAAFGLACAAGAHAGSGDWDGAEQLIREEITHYSMSPYMWYAWCLRTGHGNRAAAAAALQTYTAARGDQANADDLLEAMCVDVGENENAQALNVLRRRMALKPGPYSAMHIAMIADAANDTAARDAAIKEIDSLPDQTLPLVQFAVIIKKAIATGPSAPPDPAAVEALLAQQKDSLQITAILYLTGRYLDQHGHPAEALTYFRRCAAHDDGRGVVDMILSNDQLKRRGLDPLKEFAAAHSPDPTWLEP